MRQPMDKKNETRPVARILVVDDHSIIRDGLELLLNRQESMIVCGVAEDAESAMKEIEKLKPDIVIMDISLPHGKSGIDLTRTLTRKYKNIHVLILSMHDEAMYGQAAIKAGARGYVQKQELTNTIITAIHRIIDGELFLSRRMTTQIIDDMLQGKEEGQTVDPVDQLSDREREVLRLMAMDHSSREIGEMIGINEKTVDTYKFRIRKRLNISDSRGLIKKARELYGSRV